jgi:hypothetical protein
MEKRKKRNPQLVGYHLVPDSTGIILDSIWIKDDNTEIKIRSAFGGEWNFRPLKEDEISL